nr:glutamate receptor 2-like [Cherax quadricarinatus]
MSELLDIFADKMNFEYELIRPPDSLWGAPEADGSWTGMLGMLQRQEVEFAVGPFVVTDLRETVCDFSTSFHTENAAIITIRPTLYNDLTGFVKPYAMEVWLLMLLSLVSVTGAVTLLVWAEDKLNNCSTRNIFVKAAMWALKVLTLESSLWLPITDGSRLIVISWLLASLVFTTSYSGILTAMLTVPRVTVPIDSLEDLVAQEKLPWVVEAGSMMYQYFKEAEDGVRLKVFKGLYDTISDCWSARADIANGKFAALCDVTSMKKAMSWDFSTSGKCHLYISRENFLISSLVSVAFKINSTYLTPANHLISLVKESGILYKWLGDQITNTSQCLRPPTSDRGEGIAPLNIEVLEGSFLMLAGGLTVSLVVFLGEVAVWYLCCGDHKVLAKMLKSLQGQEPLKEGTYEQESFVASSLGHMNINLEVV